VSPHIIFFFFFHIRKYLAQIDYPCHFSTSSVTMSHDFDKQPPCSSHQLSSTFCVGLFLTKTPELPLFQPSINGVQDLARIPFTCSKTLLSSGLQKTHLWILSLCFGKEEVSFHQGFSHFLSFQVTNLRKPCFFGYNFYMVSGVHSCY